MGRVLYTQGNDQYIEDDDGNAEWHYDSVIRCLCGKVGFCKIIAQTTFSDTFACGHVTRYNNANNYPEKKIL